MGLGVCDLVFCCVSLLLYIAFGIFVALTTCFFFFNGLLKHFLLNLVVFCSALFASNLVSLYWHIFPRIERLNSEINQKWNVILSVGVHLVQLGLAWRFLRLIVSKSLTPEESQLLICEAVILRFGYSIITALISSFLSLSVVFGGYEIHSDALLVMGFVGIAEMAWSLSAIQRKGTREHFQFFVLSWPGLLSQFCWRFGTVSSRVFALALYASVYGYLIFLAWFLHFLLVACGILLLFPMEEGRADTGTRVLVNKIWKTMLTALLCSVFYFNPRNGQRNVSAVLFYVLIVFENSLLTGLWLYYSDNLGFSQRHTKLAVIVVWGGLTLGIISMLLYHGCFHINRLMPANDHARLSHKHPNNVFNCHVSIPIKRKKPTKFQHSSTPEIPTFDTAETVQMTRRYKPEGQDRISSLALDNVTPTSPEFRPQSSAESVIETSF